MARINKVFLGGNLTHDPELKDLGEGKVVNLSLAVNKKIKLKDGKTKETVLFVHLEAWNGQAEFCAEYLKKGDSVLVEGELKEARWEEDGKNRSKMYVGILNIQPQSGRKKEVHDNEMEEPEAA